MKLILIALIVAACIAVIPTSGYDATQQVIINGTTLAWKMATAYAAQDIPTFNALADQSNAGVRHYFGEDVNLLVQKMTAPADLSKPYILANNTSGGIEHKIDGMDEMNRGSYVTNDVNMLPKGMDPATLKAVNPWQQGWSRILGRDLIQPNLIK